MDVMSFLGGLLVSLAVWLFHPGPVRRWLRLEKPPPPDP